MLLECTKFDFGWGSALYPTRGAYSAPSDLLAGFQGPTSKGRKGRGRKEGGKEGQGKGEGREGVHNLRLTTPVIRWLVTGLYVERNVTFYLL